jgi:hypothetical protein
VKVLVSEPLARTVVEEGLTLTLFGGDDWVIKAVPLPPELASRAVIVQVPTVPEAV